jgi:hypothetical protein
MLALSFFYLYNLCIMNFKETRGNKNVRLVTLLIIIALAAGL